MCDLDGRATIFQSLLPKRCLLGADGDRYVSQEVGKLTKGLIGGQLFNRHMREARFDFWKAYNSM